MDWERQMSEGAETQSATSPADTRNSSSTGSAQVTDVLFDQLQYLVEHTAGNCSTECPDCRRLQMVSDWLLLPFRCRNWA
ncbi:MAG TPA: hypothetical protein VG096_21815 [Bryobacteraceae bacterium]|nr:hypothetical protein [Bryobacteraceae bacterium]